MLQVTAVGMPEKDRGGHLIGRNREREVLDRLLADVRANRSRVLVVRGEAGIGKSALLDYLSDQASRCQIARAAGTDAEIELPFASLHQLCAPLFGSIDRIPAPQQNALSAALGVGERGSTDRFVVGLAALGLLSEAAKEQPLICLVDDAQALDEASAQVLAFVARRLVADPIAIVFSVREPNQESYLVGIDELVVNGLSDGDSRALLLASLPGPIDERVRDRIVAETRGNPLALRELPRDMSAEELAGGFGLPSARHLASRIEQSFARRIQALPQRSKRLVIAAAAEPVGDAALLWRAVEELGIGADDAAPAEDAGLIDFGPHVRFRHPLIRSAAYRTASSADRRLVHRALARATDRDSDPDRRAWHLGNAAAKPDEYVANELVLSADRARKRGGIAAAAAFLEKAARLTPDTALRAKRALAAAQAKFDAAAIDAAEELIALAEISPLDGYQHASLARLKAQIAFMRRPAGASLLLVSAAEQFAPLDVRLARDTFLEGLGAAIFAGRLDGDGAERAAAEAAHRAPRASDPAQPTDLLLDAMAALYTQAYATGVPRLSEALRAFRRDAERGDDDSMRWLWLACPVAPEPVAAELWDDETWLQLATRAVQLARDSGALAVLPLALSYRAGVHVHAGEFAQAAALLEESVSICRATGAPPLPYTSLLLTAWSGDPVRAPRTIDADAAAARARGDGRAVGLAAYAAAVLHNGLGQYEVALASAQQACEHEDMGFFGWALVELVEAAARTGDRDTAEVAMHRLDERTVASGTHWALGVRARSRALLSEGETAEGLYGEAIEHLEDCRMAAHLARARLVFGEWLRREGRRRDAREQLRVAHEMFVRFGAEAFAERSRVELVATGQTVRKRVTGAREGLTAQESQIATLAAAGHTNIEIAGQLFISPRTVEYHLSNIFAKLDISSRRMLRRTSEFAATTGSPS